jgi:hypothetical protein
MYSTPQVQKKRMYAMQVVMVVVGDGFFPLPSRAILRARSQNECNLGTLEFHSHLRYHLVRRSPSRKRNATPHATGRITCAPGDTHRLDYLGVYVLDGDHGPETAHRMAHSFDNKEGDEETGTKPIPNPDTVVFFFQE